MLDESFEAVLSQADDIAADFEDAKALLDDAGDPREAPRATTRPSGRSCGTSLRAS